MRANLGVGLDTGHTAPISTPHPQVQVLPDRELYSRAMNTNGRAHAGTAGRLSVVKPDSLLEEAADSHEDEAARAHLEGAEPADFLDEEVGLAGGGGGRRRRGGRESGAEHLAMLATPPVFSDTPLKVPRGLGHDFGSKGEAIEAPQPRVVEAMCRANWHAQKRPTRQSEPPGEGRHLWS
jgi:hypothetical protein